MKIDANFESIDMLRFVNRKVPPDYAQDGGEMSHQHSSIARAAPRH